MPQIELPITRTELAERLGVSRVTLWAWERAKLIPAAERINGRRVEFSAASTMVAAAVAEARGHHGS